MSTELMNENSNNDNDDDDDDDDDNDIKVTSRCYPYPHFILTSRFMDGISRRNFNESCDDSICRTVNNGLSYFYNICLEQILAVE